MVTETNFTWCKKSNFHKEKNAPIFSFFFFNSYSLDRERGVNYTFLGVKSVAVVTETDFTWCKKSNFHKEKNAPIFSFFLIVIVLKDRERVV